ncbi:SlyX protein [Pasteurella testudinis]|uniref:SlyX protein n=1 Tax=Pasteurella testudinis TaxID=761 RepID=UPI0040595710
MTTLKVLPKKSYSISDTVKYISGNYNINISEKDILEYIQSGALKSSIHLHCSHSKITEINRKEVDKKNKLFIRNEGLFFKFDKTETKAKVLKREEFSTIEIYFENIYFKFGIYLNAEYYIYEELANAEEIILCSAGMDKFKHIYFSGYMPIHSQFIEQYNIDKLIKIGFIEEFPDISFIGNSFHCLITVEENRTKLYLDDLCILHKDLISFLELFSVIDKTYDQIEDITQLKAKIKKQEQIILEKETEIAQLQTALDDKNIPQLLGVYRDDDPLKIAIEVRNKYWSSYPENVKSNAQIRDYIMRYYGITSKTRAEYIEVVACPIDRKKN